MTIDPMAAVTTATNGIASPAASADPAASANSTISPQSTTQPPTSDQGGADRGNGVDLFDYTSKQQHAPPAIDTLAPESKAKYLANPAELGGKVLEKIESFHQRATDFRNQSQSAPAAQTTALSSADGVMGGPAQQHVAGTANPGQDMIDGLQRVMDYSIETTMMTTSSSQFTKTVNTLMKGQ